MSVRLPRPVINIAVAGALTLSAITATAGFLLGRYELIPRGIPVHWHNGRPDVFMPKSIGVVFVPLWTQLILATVIGAVAVLLLYRAQATGGDGDEAAHDRDRMLHGAEAIALLGFIWIAFQAVTAWGVTELWLNYGGGMGRIYNVGFITSIVVSIVVGGRAALRIGKPTARHVADPTLWRWKALYFNPADPALFVPARFGYGLTLNFGRPLAVALMLGLLVFGLGGPYLLARMLLVR
jgi:uncharacterized membrane protein